MFEEARVPRQIKLNQDKDARYCAFPVHRFPEILISSRKVSRQDPGKKGKTRETYRETFQCS